MIDNSDEQIGQLGLRLATSIAVLSASILAISSGDPARVAAARESLTNDLRYSMAELGKMAEADREEIRARHEFIDACAASPETKAKLRARTSVAEDRIRMLEETFAHVRLLAGPELDAGQEVG